MKLRTIVKIAITSSVALLCTGFVLYSYFKLSSVENQKDFNLYTLVPSSTSAVFVTNDAAEFMAEVDGLTCSNNQQYLHVSKLFSYLKQYLYTLGEDTPHGLSRQMNQVLISFHEPDNECNQVLYCTLGDGDKALIEKFVHKYTSSGYQPKLFKYEGEDIRIYPMSDGDFLSCYITPDFMALSYQKKLIEQVIDARKSGKSLADDSAFIKACTPVKSPSVATLYTRLEGLLGWTEFDMKLKDDYLYFSGISHDIDSCFVFAANAASLQEPAKGFPGGLLPATTFYFSKQEVTDWTSFPRLAGTADGCAGRSEYNGQDKALVHYLMEYAGKDLMTCIFQREDTLQGPATVISLPVVDGLQAEKVLRSIVDTTPVEAGMPSGKRFTFCYTPDKAYPVYILPSASLFVQLAKFAKSDAPIYATFYGGRLLLAPDMDSLSRYIRQMDNGEILDGVAFYREGTGSLSDSYHFMLMADFEHVFQQPELYTRLIPDFFFRNADFFCNFTLFAQFTCADGLVYPNIVLRYKQSEKLRITLI